MQTYLEPTQDAGRALLMRGIPGEVVMLNLLRLREVADYAANPELAPERPISGRRPMIVTSPIPFHIWPRAVGRCSSWRMADLF
jgi:hypothetical protein